MTMDVPGYERLADVLQRAYAQAAVGKGKERHAQGMPFHEQPMQRMSDLYGVGFTLGQAAKKSQESQRLPHDRAIAELLGAINYIAGAIVYLERTVAPTTAKSAPSDVAVSRGEDTEKENMQKFTAAEVTDNLLHQKFPRSATHAEFLSYCRTIIRGGTMETNYASSLYVPEQVKATGRYAMKEEYVGEYGA